MHCLPFSPFPIQHFPGTNHAFWGQNLFQHGRFASPDLICSFHRDVIILLFFQSSSHLFHYHFHIGLCRANGSSWGMRYTTFCVHRKCGKTTISLCKFLKHFMFPNKWYPHMCRGSMYICAPCTGCAMTPTVFYECALLSFRRRSLHISSLLIPLKCTSHLYLAIQLFFFVSTIQNFVIPKKIFSANILMLISAFWLK